MKKWFKRGIFTVVTLLIVTLVGVAVFLLTFDPNAYKERVEQIVYERYQRQLKINGEIELSLFPRIGLSVADVSLSDRNSEQTFAAVDSARVAVAVWPLLWNHLVVDHVAVSGFKVWLSRNEEGAFNFTDLLQRSTPLQLQSKRKPFLSPIATAHAESSTPLGHDTDETVFQIDIAGLELKEGEIHFFDSSSQTQMRLVDLDINTGRMTFDQPFDVIFKGQLRGDKPQAKATLTGQTMLQLEPHLRRYMAQRINVSLVGDIGHYKANTATLRGGLELLTLTEDLRARNIEFISQGRWQNSTITLNKTTMNLTASQLNLKRNLAVIQTNKLKVRAHGLLPIADSEAEHKVEFALDVPQLSVEPEQVQSEPIALSFKQSQGVNLFGINARIKALSGTLAQLHVEQIQGDVAGKNNHTAWKLEAISNAQVQVQDQDFDLQWQDLDANLRVDDDALNPNPAHAKITSSGQWLSAKKQLQIDGLWQSANTHAQFESTLRREDNWLIDVNIDANEVDINPWLRSVALRQQRQQERGAKAAAPIKTAFAPMLPDYINWSAWQAQLNMKAAELHLKGYRFQDLDLKAEQKTGVAALTQLQAKLFDGEIDAAASWHAAQATAKVKAQLNQIDLAHLSKATALTVPLEGQANLRLDLQTAGRTAAARWAGLGGNAVLEASDGRLIGWSFWQQLAAANEAMRNMFSGHVAELPVEFNAEQSTPFTQLNAHLTIEQGQAQFSQLALVAPGLEIKAEPHAYIDLVNEQVQMAFQADIQTTALAANQTSLEVYAVEPLFIRLSGPWRALEFGWQWQRLEHPEVKEAIDNGFLELLGKPDLSTVIESSEPAS